MSFDFGYENEDQASVENISEQQTQQQFAWYKDVPKIRDDGDLCPQCGHILTLPDKEECTDLHCDSCGFQPAFMGAQMEHFNFLHPESKYLTYYFLFLLFALLLYFVRFTKDGQSPWTLALIVVCPVAYIGYVILEISVGLDCGRMPNGAFFAPQPYVPPAVNPAYTPQQYVPPAVNPAMQRPLQPPL